MSEISKRNTRREFLKQSGRLAATSLVAAAVIPRVHAAENNTIQLALVGCGGRGTGAAANALSTTSGPIKLVAMADVFDRRLATSHANLAKQVSRTGRRAPGPPVHRLRRLSEGHGLSPARRRRHSHHALRVPLGPFRLRHREGHQRLHGEADDGRRPEHAQDARAGRTVGEEESEGRRRSDVPPLQGPLGTAGPNPGRPDRRHHLHEDLSPGRSRRVSAVPSRRT